MTEVRPVQQSVTEVACDVLVVNLFQGVTHPGGATGAVDQALGGLISAAIAAGDLKGKLGEATLFYTGGRIPARKVLVTGLGQADQFDLRRARQAALAATRAAARSGARVVATIAHGAGIGGLDPAAAAQFTVDGSLHGAYRFAGYKTGEDRAEAGVAEVLLVERDAARLAAIAPRVETGRELAAGVAFARDLANMPGNLLTPTGLADAAAAMARQVGLECQILGPAELERQGFGLLLAVSRGSVEPPACVVLRHRGATGRANGAGSRPQLALVGKGLTFDSGGISIKPTAEMWDMKYDMCGGGAVLGAMQAIARLRVAADVLAVVPASENMTDGAAFKPGDVLEGLSGKTVEIHSTDAEGRLILADGLAYAVQQGAERIITASTLTGGARAALGDVRFAFLANDNAWFSEVEAAASAVGERGWRLPDDDDYLDLLKSEVADMLNGHGTRKDAHTVQGGLFLFQHVSGRPTVHMDIAATAYRKAAGRHEDQGATGVGVRTMVEAARRIAARGPR